MVSTRSPFAIAAASLDTLPTSAHFEAAAVEALRRRNGKATSQLYTSKGSREKSDLDDNSTNPVRDAAWIADQIILLQNCKRLHDEVTAATAPRFSWKDNFVHQDDPNLFAFQTLIGLMLSSAVNDEVVIGAMKDLATKGFFSTITALADASFSVVLSCLAHVNYNNKKAKQIIDAAQYIVTNFNSIVPCSFEKLQKINGVGMKMAALTLLEGFDDDSYAIHGIDSHMYKLFRTYLHWVDIEDTSVPMMAGKIKEWLPKNYWRELNPTFSGLGQLFRLVKKDKWEKEMYVKAEDVGGASFKEKIVKLSLLYQNQAKRKTELRRQELKRNPPTVDDLLSLSNGRLISDLLILGWEQSYKNKSLWRIYREGYNDLNPGVYNSDWFDHEHLVRDYISNKTGRRRASRRDIVHYYLTTTNKPKTINTSNNKDNKNDDDKQHYANAKLFVEKNFHKDFDLSLINVGGGDSIGWYLYGMKGGRKVYFPVICLRTEDGTNKNTNINSLRIQYFGKHTRFASTLDSIDACKFISLEQCNNHVNEEYLQSYVKYLQTLLPFKNDPLLQNIEKCYIQKIWKALYPSLEIDCNEETDNNTDNDDNEKEMKSEYELLRIQRIKRNEEKLRQLGLDQFRRKYNNNNEDDDDNDVIIIVDDDDNAVSDNDTVDDSINNDAVDDKNDDNEDDDDYNNDDNDDDDDGESDDVINVDNDDDTVTDTDADDEVTGNVSDDDDCTAIDTDTDLNKSITTSKAKRTGKKEESNSILTDSNNTDCRKENIVSTDNSTDSAAGFVKTSNKTRDKDCGINTTGSSDDIPGVITETTTMTTKKKKMKKKIATRRKKIDGASSTSRKKIVASILMRRTRRTKRQPKLLGSIIDPSSGLRYSARIFLLQISVDQKSKR